MEGGADAVREEMSLTIGDGERHGKPLPGHGWICRSNASPCSSTMPGSELWPKLGDGGLRRAAYRGGWKPA